MKHRDAWKWWIGYHLIAGIPLLLFHSQCSDRITGLRFDAVHYMWIAENGYEGFRMAFFPLFPLLWHISGLSVLGVSLFNGALYLVAGAVLIKALEVDRRVALIWAAVPNTVFYFVPYSEALFFVGGTLLILGVRRPLIWLSSLGLLICVLARPAFTALLPALIVMEILSSHSRSATVRRSIVHLTVCAFGLGIVMILQHQDTGEWLGFYSAQSGWGNELRMPTLPLASWGGTGIVRLDWVALAAGLSSLVWLLRRILVSNGSVVFRTRREVLLAGGYLAFVSLIPLMLHGGSMHSLNRFVFATPFTLVLVHALLENGEQVPLRKLAGFGSALLASSLLFGSYVHIQNLLGYTMVTCFLLAFAFLAGRRYRDADTVLCVWLTLAFILQQYFTLHFFQGGWVA